MRRLRTLALTALAVAALAGPSRADRAIKLASDPALSPDGKTLAFSYRGEIWTVPVDGGAARPLTRHDADDAEPHFSPDGEQIAFTSDRGDGRQVFVMPAEGGEPRQLTHHTGGYSLQGYYPDGNHLLVNARRDHYWYDPERFFRIKADERSAEEPLFDAYGTDGSLSPDGKRLLFTREGEQWWRKGYKGTQASQVWMYNLDTEAFTRLIDREDGARWPLWKPDGEGFYFVAPNEGALNLWEYSLDSKDSKPLTSMTDDSVITPCLSKDGSTIVFRHLFDFYRFRPGKDDHPVKIEIVDGGDVALDPIERRTLDRASDVAFTKDGLEVAFIAGGDLWVMDTELAEPRQVTSTPEEERDPLWSPDGKALYVVSDQGGQPDIWKVERADPDAYWWRNESFKLDRVTQDADVESSLSFSPNGEHLAFLKGAGNLILLDPRNGQTRKVVESWDGLQYDWSPDSKWLAYSKNDEFYNRDIFVKPIDGSREEFNLSVHPRNDYDPAWSPDGKAIAFVGSRDDDETDIHFVYLRREDSEQTGRDRTLEKALEKMAKARKKDEPKKDEPEKKDDDNKDEPKKEGDDKKEEAKDDDKKDEKSEEVVIDFDGLHDRIQRVTIPGARERGLLWSPDSKKLVFSTSIDGKGGLYSIEPPDDLRPKPFAGPELSRARWLKEGNQIVGLNNGVPTSVAAGQGGKESAYRFQARQQFDRAAKFRAAFELAWRIMRDQFYDERLGNKNWDAVRRKYADMAAAAPDAETFGTVVNLMLGELNGSHLGFYTSGRRGGGGGGAEDRSWGVVTAHLGLRFDPEFKGPGLKVRDVIPDGPTDRAKALVVPGEVVVSIDGTNVDPSMDLTTVLNGPIDREIDLVIRDDEGENREIKVRPIPVPYAQSLLYEKFVRDNRKAVDAMSDGKLGYLHIRGMNFPSFWRFEQELYSVGYGKDGLVIDVRNNGGGSTADHLLTSLFQPQHAITVGRGGKPGYPRDRMVYTAWTKPIVVLCNQNSFSNAEIFSHAIKTLERGKLVGVTTAGGVISTGATGVMDLGTMRLPGRGWFLIGDGQDMELNGAVPDVILWPEPGELPAGKDRQLEKAVEVLLQDVAEAAKEPQPELQKASER